MKKKKVLIVLPNNWNKGGVQTCCIRIVSDLHEKYDFYATRYKKDVGFYEKEFVDLGGTDFLIDLSRFEVDANNAIVRSIQKIKRKLFSYKFLYHQFCKLFKSNKFDVIHINDLRYAATIAKAAKKSGIKKVITHVHTNTYMKSKTYRKNIEKYTDVKIAASSHCVASVFDNEENVSIIKFGVDTKVFDVNKYPRQPIMTSINLIHVGSFCDNKNQLFLIDLCKELNHIKDTRLHLVGFSNTVPMEKYKELLINTAADYGISDKVIFYEPDTNIPEIMSKCTCLVFPSKKEAYGIVPLEAQTMGLNCILSDTLSKEVDLGLCRYLSINEGVDEWVKAVLEIEASIMNSVITEKKVMSLKDYTDAFDHIYSNIDE